VVCAITIRWIGIGIGFAALSLLIGVVGVIEQLSRPDYTTALGGAALAIAAAEFFYFGARAAAWVVEGFAAPK